MPSATPPGISIEERVRRAQIDALFGTNRRARHAEILLAVGVTVFFYWRTGSPWAWLWLALRVIQFLRIRTTRDYLNDPDRHARSAIWSRGYVRAVAINSAIWGLTPWMVMPTDDLSLQLLMMLVILGMAAAGVASVAPHWPVVPALVLPMGLGLASALAWHTEATSGFMAACCLLYLFALLGFARQQHQSLAESFRARFEKEDMAAALARQAAVAERASAEKTRFFAAASHDLRQPLHAVGLFGAVLERELRAHPQHETATRLLQAVQALDNSLDTMLDVSRLDAGVVERTMAMLPLNPLLQHLGQMFMGKADERGLQLRVRATPLWVHSDRALLQRLLSNLIDNAIKHTERGGVLVIARPRGAHVWIDVVDTGCGIAPEHQEQVFAEFYQVGNPGRDRARGLGMGLSIVRRLSQLLGHKVLLRSWPGRGTRLRVVVPSAEAPVRASAPCTRAPAAPCAPQASRSARLLLVEDETAIAQGMQALLALQGWRLEHAATPEEAHACLHRAVAQGRPFDGLICDLRLAGGADGLALALALRAASPQGLPTLLVTGETAPGPLQRVREAGLPVLFKPVVAPALIDSIGMLLQGSR